MTPKQLKTIREKLGLSAKQLSVVLRLSDATSGRTVRNWEQGKYPISGPASLALEYLLRDWVEGRNNK